MLLFCDWKYLLTCSVVPYCPCGCLCVSEFDVLVSVLECGSTFRLRTQDVSVLTFFCTFAFTFSLSSLLLIHFSLFLSLSFSFSSSLSRLSFLLTMECQRMGEKIACEYDCYVRGLSAAFLVVSKFVLHSSRTCSKCREKKKLAKTNQA